MRSLAVLEQVGSLGNKLRVPAMIYLVRARMPELQHLNLSNNRLDARAAEHLAGGAWPKLTILRLCNNCIDNFGVDQLSKGCWPELHTLKLNGNAFTDVTSFSSARWPLLKRLVLDKELLSAANLNALDLSCDILQDLEEVLDIEAVFVSRQNRTAVSEVHIWPHLAEVGFYP